MLPDGAIPVQPEPLEPGEVREGQAFTALFIAGAIGGDPEIKLEEILTEKSLPLFDHLYERSREQLSMEDSWGGLGWNEQLRSTPSPSRTKLIEQLEAMHPARAIDARIRISQANTDTRVSPILTSALKTTLTLIRGNKVAYVPYDEVARTEGEFERLGHHFGLLDTDRGPLVEWLKERFGAVS